MNSDLTGRLRAEALRLGFERLGIAPGVGAGVGASFVYGRAEPAPPGPTQGKVARYARGDDYHELLWRRLERLLEWLCAEVPAVRGRAVADTGPLPARD